RAVFVAASRARLAFHVYPRCCERAVIFEEEVSVQIIEVLSESPRVTLAIDTNRDDQVFVPIAAWRAGRIKGPGEMVVMIAPIHSLLVRALTKGSRDQVRAFKFQPVTVPLIKREHFRASRCAHVMDAPHADDRTMTSGLGCGRQAQTGQD